MDDDEHGGGGGVGMLALPVSRTITPDTIGEETGELLLPVRFFVDKIEKPSSSGEDAGGGGGGGGDASTSGAVTGSAESSPSLDKYTIFEEYQKEKLIDLTSRIDGYREEIETAKSRIKHLKLVVNSTNLRDDISEKKYAEDIESLSIDIKKASEIIVRNEIYLGAEEGSVTKFASEFEKDPNELRKNILEKKYQFKGVDGLEGPEIIRYGMVTDKFRHIIGTESFGILHPAEFIALTQAIDFLLEKQSATVTSADYKNNVVLCDIFARTDGKIKATGTLPETHTVALWKISDTQILIIDPNSWNFSKIIENELFEQLKGAMNLTLKSLNSNEVKDIIGKDFRFYNPDKEKDIKRYRDCIDISVKIGFEIQRLSLELTDYKKILKQVCENMSVTFGLFPEFKYLRAAHSSDEAKREEFRELYEGLHPNLANKLLAIKGKK